MRKLILFHEAIGNRGFRKSIRNDEAYVLTVDQRFNITNEKSRKKMNTNKKNMNTNKNYKYKNYTDAFNALIKDFSEDFDWESNDCIDSWLSEFIRGASADWDWMNAAVNAIGHQNHTVQHWFNAQNENPSRWSARDFELISTFSDAFSD